VRNGVFSYLNGEIWVEMGNSHVLRKHHHTIDDNNRLAMPSSIRKCVDEEKEGKGFYITPGLDKCLAIYPPLHFNEITQKLKELMFTNKKARTFHRLFFSRSSLLPVTNREELLYLNCTRIMPALRRKSLLLV
jgi:division/cell wall cluster transcriptional repressor MraZ